MEIRETLHNKTGIRPNVLEEIGRFAERYGLQRVILFGSRARGDYRRTSDIDLAVVGGDTARFSLDVEEESSTLLKYDIVDLNMPVQSDLKEAIEKEGIVLYEKI